MGGCAGVERTKQHDQKVVQDPSQLQDTDIQDLGQLQDTGCYLAPEPFCEKTPPLPPANYPIYIGKYDYDSRTDDDLRFKKGDLMYIISRSEDGWWFARSKHVGKEGYIPSNYVTEWKTIDGEEWFFGRISTYEAVKHLMQPHNSNGSYLLRYSETDGYTLSIRDQEHVKHYQVRQLDNGRFFVIEGVAFSSVQELVMHYQGQAGGLCCSLQPPCLFTEKPQTVGLSKQANEKWEIDRRQIKLVRKVGEGQFAEVWEGLWNATTQVAVKIVHPSVMLPSEFLVEAAAMKQLHHSKLVQLYAVCAKEEPIYIISEFMKYGSLLKYLRGDGRSLKLPQLIDIAAQVAAGMTYLEEQNYVHRDLAARNILVGEHLICKVTDFGLTRVIDYNECDQFKLPYKWIAPEALLYNRYSIKSDVWSFGIVLYEIITHGRSPYAGMDTALEKVELGYRMGCPPGCPSYLYDVMRDCWKEDPDFRPAFKMIQFQLKEFFTLEDWK